MERVKGLTVTTYAQRPDLLERLEAAVAGAFPDFLLHDPVWDECWPQVLAAWPELQVFLLDPENDDPVAMLNAIALAWDGTSANLPAGTHAALRQSLREAAAGQALDTGCLIQAVLDPAHQGRGLGGAVMRRFLSSARALGYRRLISPIRPTDKHSYPTVALERYVTWSRSDGLPLDPWLRVQARLGGKRLEVSPDSLVIEASTREWEQWTGLRFPDSGEYVIPGGQVPLVIDRMADRGRYSEPHVWFEYDAGAPADELPGRTSPGGLGPSRPC